MIYTVYTNIHFFPILRLMSSKQVAIIISFIHIYNSIKSLYEHNFINIVLCILLMSWMKYLFSFQFKDIVILMVYTYT